MAALGAFLGEFVKGDDGGLTHAISMSFGPDGNFYVVHLKRGEANSSVLRFHGPSATAPGTAMPSAGNSGADFVPAGSGGMRSPLAALFGPDGNGDGNLDLYVASADTTGQLKGQNKTATVKRYDGATGAFIDTLVPEGSGGLDDPSFMTFTETDPVTLAYRPRVSIGDVTKAEGKNGQSTFFTFTVTLSTIFNQPITMSFGTVAATATVDDKDFVPLTGTLTFSPGEFSKTITIQVIGDRKNESDEFFYLDLFGLSDNALFSKSRGLGTIKNDD